MPKYEDDHIHDETLEAEAAATAMGDGRASRLRYRLGNFWYHYKWHSLVALFLAVVMVFCVAQCSSREDNDVYILYAGPWLSYNDGAQREAVTQAFSAVMQDYNGDGTRVVSYRTILMMNETQLKDLAAQYEGREDEMPIIQSSFLAQQAELYRNEIASGDTVLCLLDISLFHELKDEGWLLPLTNYVPEEDVPENDLEDYGVYLKDTAFGQYFSGVKDMPEDTVLCIRAASILNTWGWQREERAAELHARHEDLLRRVLAFTPPQED